MKTLLPLSAAQEQVQQLRPTLRIDIPAANYARRSDYKAKDENKDKSQSREMQTEDMIEWAMGVGWKEKYLKPYFADLGLSGTLRPDQRPDMLRLFDDIDNGDFDHGSVICWQENRLFRDETQIYYNQFIDKCKQHDIVVVVISPYLVIYDFQDDFLTEMFRWKCKESAEFIKRQVKGWMIPAKKRAAWHDGEWAGMGDPPTGFIVDFDEHSPTYKKLIPYWPHAEKKREIRELFVELGCDVSLLFKRLRERPIIFPAFEEWVDQRNVKRFKMTKYPGGGYYPKSKGTLISMLTDPTDIGYRVIEGVIRRNRQGEKIIDHEPIVDRELFDLSYFALAKTDLDGNPLGVNRAKRYFHHSSKGDYGLLKFRIKSNQGVVRAHIDGDYEKGVPTTGGYFIVYDKSQDCLEHLVTVTAIPCEEIDTIVVNRLMEHVAELSSNQEEIAEYERRAKKIRAERQRKIKQIENSIEHIGREQVELVGSLGKVEQEIAEEENQEKKEIKERRKELINERIDILELERRKLKKAKKDLEEEAEGDLGSLDEELKKLQTLWPQYTFEKRRSLLNFIVKEVVIDTMSTHWVRVQVLWLHEEWGREEMHYYRNRGMNKQWTEEEDVILRAHYETMPKPELMALLPDRGWEAVIAHAITFALSRQLQGRPKGLTVGGNKHDSYADVQFMHSRGIEKTTRRTNWEKLYPH